VSFRPWASPKTAKEASRIPKHFMIKIQGSKRFKCERPAARDFRKI
jgi:hypothetical protein